MEELVVTSEHLSQALQFGACASLPKVGTNVLDISQADLVWAENVGIKIKAPVPIWALSSDGYGYGYGYGSGYGSGYGCGDGYGYGDRDGSGYGCGDGYGDRDRDGSGYVKLMSILGFKE